MMQILMSIIVLAIILFGSVFAFQQITIKKVNKMQTQIDSLHDKSVQSKINKVNDMRLTGKSLDALNTLLDKYDNINNSIVPELNDVIDDILFNVRGFNVVKTYNERKKANKLLSNAKEEMDRVLSELDKIDKIEEKHKKVIDELQDSYDSLEESFSLEKDKYGDSVVLLKERLAKISEQFEDCAVVSSQHDYVAADEIIKELSSNLKDLEELSSKIPPLYSDLNVEYTEQIGDIEDGYNQMLAAHFVFPTTSIPEKIKGIKSDIEIAKKHLKELDVSTTVVDGQNIESQIDELYDILEKEIKIKPKVIQQRKKIIQFIEHARKQNALLQSELDKLNQGFILDHGEIDQAKSLADRIQINATRFQEDNDAIQLHTESFSSIYQHQIQQIQNLTDIEQEQRELNNSVKDLPVEEKSAISKLRSFDNQVRTLKREINNLNLPGLTDDFLDEFDIVENGIDKLSNELSHVQINMEDVDKQLMVVQSDFTSLNERVSKLKDNVLLVEQSLQYANLYKNNSEVLSAIEHAKQLFRYEYKYGAALQVMKDILDKIEPGSYQRIENSYYGIKQK